MFVTEVPIYKKLALFEIMPYMRRQASMLHYGDHAPTHNLVLLRVFYFRVENSYNLYAWGQILLTPKYRLREMLLRQTSMEYRPI